MATWSTALRRWEQERSKQLDEIEAAHTAVGGRGRGRRVATLQVNYAYTVLLTSQFQGFCRDLHTESADVVAGAVDSRLRDLVYLRLTQGRKLDRGNPNPGHLGADFGRFDIDLWPGLFRVQNRNRSRQTLLSDLCAWRNAIAHQDFSQVGGTGTLHLNTVRRWRGACKQLTRSIDRLLYNHLRDLTGSPPWS